MDAQVLARWQFGITTVYHFFFVPVTLGTAWLVAVMETRWLRTKDVQWLRMTKFFAKLFLINFAAGVVTGKLGWGAALAANLPYLPGDLIKCVLAAFVAKAVHSAYPGLLPWRGNAVEPAPPNL